MPHIAVINRSTVVSARAIAAMLPAFERQWARDLGPIWGVDEATLSLVRPNREPPRSAWWLVFLDDSNQAHRLAYHDLTDEGLPISKVYARTVLNRGASVSVSASHELCEMAVDPWLNGSYQDDNEAFWAGEVCDPVQGDRYSYAIRGTRVSDFVTPEWFGHARRGVPVDFRGHTKRSFHVLPGGYAQKYETRRGWVQVHGAPTAGPKRTPPAPGSRRERRARGEARWQRSSPDLEG